MRYCYDCSFYGVSGMATDHKFQKTFDHLCFDRPKFFFLNNEFSDLRRLSSNFVDTKG